jgi:hypothetical protein
MSTRMTVPGTMVALAILCAAAIQCGKKSSSLGATSPGPDAGATADASTYPDAAAAPGIGSCPFDGGLVPLGYLFARDSNTCTCTAFGIGCTSLVCVDDAGVGPDAEDGGTCALDGGFVPLGYTFRQDCNNCTCIGEGIACTEIACADPSEAGPVDAGMEAETDDTGAPADAGEETSGDP